MLIIYTGNGKGKTSACVGQTIRAIGNNLTVAFGQFMKRDVQAGEQQLLTTLLGPRFHIGGSGFFRNEQDRPKHRFAAQQTLLWSTEQLPLVNMLVLDEALYALGAELLFQNELEELITTACNHNTHLVLSGRGLPVWLKEQADLVTEMCEIKHPIHQGIVAARGIEF